jgi:predicted TIM-barrel fold metal-dependent hydrolase
MNERTPVVDAHLHLFGPSTTDRPRAVYPGMADADRSEPAERLLAAMAEVGVDHAVVVPLSKEDDHLAEVLRDHPGRFTGVGIFEHERPDDVAGLEARLARCDLRGLRFYGLGVESGVDVRSLAVYPVMELMAERGMVVWFYGDEVQLAAMGEIMDRLPSLRVVLNHSGFLPDMHAEMRIDEHRRPHFDVVLPPPSLSVVEAMAHRYERLFVHFSGHYAFSHQGWPYRDLTEVAERLVAAFGVSRMMRASDWPWIRDEPGYGRILDVDRELLPSLDDDERAMLRGGTAARLFGIV